MSVTIPEILSHYSALGYSAGDVALDRHRVGRRRASARTPASLYLKPGDVMEAEIERIGVLRNPVVSWQDGARRAAAASASAGDAAPSNRTPPPWVGHVPASARESTVRWRSCAQCL